MKFRIKALDNHEEDWANTKRELEIVEDFYRAKYTNNEIEKLSINDSVSKLDTRVVTWVKNKIEYIVSINYENKFVAKATQPHIKYEPFTKDELKLFDLLDYNIHHIHQKEVGQDITDWVTM